MTKYLFSFFLFLFGLHAVHAQTQEVREYMDLQTHPCMHVVYPFFSKGLQFFTPGNEPKLSYKHQLKNVNYANYLKNNKGARIIVVGALTREGVKSERRARKTILKQINYVNRFAEENAEDFAVAKSPQEVRRLLATSDKTIIIHSIEGAKKLVNSQADADFWAAQGVAYITLIHLVDSDLGSSAIRPDLVTKLINYKGAIRRTEKRGGLTQKGKQAILWLANAGIMTDITHMSDQCRIDALNFMEANSIPPIATHDLFRPIQNHPRGISEAQILKIYKNDGFISLPISGMSLKPHKPHPRIKAKLDSMECYCNGSVDSYKFTYLEVKSFIESNYKSILEDSNTLNFSELKESEKVRLSIGFQSDFNGWLNHSKPRFGKEGCQPLEPNKTYEPIEVDGMPHPGYLSSQWRLLEKEGVDLAPIKRNSERFLQVWEHFLSRRDEN